MFRQNAKLLRQSDINLLGQIMWFENLFIVRKGGIWLNNISWNLIRWQKPFISDLLNSTGVPNLKSHQSWDFRIPIQQIRCCILLKFYLRKIRDSKELMGQNSLWVQIENILKFSYLKECCMSYSIILGPFCLKPCAKHGSYSESILKLTHSFVLN